MAPAAFDFYVLALSWSPSFCDNGGAAKSPSQCATGSGLGFVVHGLWPQNQQGYPINCGGGRFPSRMALEGARDIYPDEGLARHEWRAHGTCSGLSPTDYFATVGNARDSITIPPGIGTANGPATVAVRDVVAAFIASNQGLRPDAMAVTCAAGELAEVRVCLSKDLRGFVSCPDVSRSACRSRSIAVPAPR